MGYAIVRDNTKTVTKREVEERLAKVGDYVKMDFLSQCLKKNLDFDTKKFVLMKLAEIYESRKMFSEAAKVMRGAAEINSTYESKLNDFMKSGTLFVKGGAFDEADVSFTKAMGCATDLQKQRIKATRKEAYKAQAKEFVSRERRSHAAIAYEKLLNMDLPPLEKKEMQTTLLGLYERLGKVKEYYALKANIK
jgi:tetratricopeptide (TPR) repeat protein